TARNRRRRGDLKLARPLQFHAGVYLHLAILAETGARLARPRIKRDHARINRAHENALAAARPFRSRLIHPGRNTAANELVTGAVVDGNFRIEAPFLLPRARIKRDHFIEGATENK